MPKVHALYMMGCKEGEPERERERGERGAYTITYMYCRLHTCDDL